MRAASTVHHWRCIDCESEHSSPLKVNSCESAANTVHHSKFKVAIEGL